VKKITEIKIHIGIDIGKSSCVACVVDQDGKELLHTVYKNTRHDAEEFVKMIRRRFKNCNAVCETTARMWIKTYETFEKYNIPIKVANTLRLKMSQSGLKTDKIDARRLANRLRVNDIPECYVPTLVNRRILDILRQRVILVQERTRVLNRQQSLMEKYDYKVIAHNGNTHDERHQTYLSVLELDSNDTRMMMQYIRHVRYLNGEINTLEKLIEEAAYNNEYAKLIMSMPGFGPFYSLYVAASIDDISRFDNPKKLVSYMGLCPRIHQSGDTTWYGHMKKDVDRTLKWVMMNAAMIAAQHDASLKKLSQNYLKRHPKKVARSHTANKMGIYLWHMLYNNEPYRNHVEKKYKQKLARLKRRH